MKRLLALISQAVLFGSLLLLPLVASAQTDVSVTATVPSKVHPDQSTVVADLLELPADNLSTVIITVTVKDGGGVSLNNIPVRLSSNRGSVDNIFAYDGSTLTTSPNGISNSEGVVRFSVRSAAPGKATFTARADDMVDLTQEPDVTFTPLPILENLTVTVGLPSGKKVTVFKPKPTPTAPTPTPTPTEPTLPDDSEPPTDRLVNTGINIEIPLFSFILIALALIILPILLIITLYLVIKVRRGFRKEQLALKKEQELLSKIYELEKQMASTQRAEAEEISEIKEQQADLTDHQSNPPPPTAGGSS